MRVFEVLFFFRGMGQTPFHLRPIEFDGFNPLDAERISITRDLAAKVTLSSTHVSVKLPELVTNLRKKDLSRFLARRQEEEVIVITESILELLRTPDEEESTSAFPVVPAFVGFLAGALAAVITLPNIPALLFVPIVIAGILGVGAGYYMQQYYQQNKTRIQAFLREFLELDS